MKCYANIELCECKDWLNSCGRWSVESQSHTTRVNATHKDILLAHCALVAMEPIVQLDYTIPCCSAEHLVCLCGQNFVFCLHEQKFAKCIGRNSSNFSTL